MSLRTLTIGGVKGIFHKDAFRRYFERKCQREDLKKEELKQLLAEKIGVSRDTVHKWYGNGGGPIDTETLCRLANAMDLPDPWQILIPVEEDLPAPPMTDREKAAAKRIYDEILLFLEEYQETLGYFTLWLQEKEQGSSDPESLVFDRIGCHFHKLGLILNQEFFDLHHSDIYFPLCDFVSDTLELIPIPLNMFEEAALRKQQDRSLSYKDAIESYVWNCFDQAMNQINSIIETYV